MSFRVLALLPALAAVLAAPSAAHAQATAGGPPFTPFKDTAMLRSSAQHPVAILEYEDLECPACATAAPVIKTALEHYKVPYLRHDFPLQMHVWSRDGAIIARYLEDKVNPDLAEQYRRDVFASQRSIASKDDLQNFSRRWFQQHGQQFPFVVDPSGRFAAEVQADYTSGERLGLIHTPTIVVLGPKGWTEVTDVTQLYTVLDKTQEEAKNSTPAVHNNVRKPRTTQK